MESLIFQALGNRTPEHTQNTVLATTLIFVPTLLQGLYRQTYVQHVFRWLGDKSLTEDNISDDFVIDDMNPLHEGIGTANEHFHLRLGN